MGQKVCVMSKVEENEAGLTDRQGSKQDWRPTCDLMRVVTKGLNGSL